jgi:Zn finger protein HypA/HybF involved in hydrogenase expression
LCISRVAWDTQCPSCQGKKSHLISGREFRVESLEII